jgi:D-glycero-alpha-D-manno-heptose-7-phosphate kinase
MIITRTPFRISFFGGGTDYPVYYKEHGGAVLNVTINKYCYVTCRYLPPFFDHKFRIRYSLREETNKIDDIKHPSVRECIKFVGIDRGIEMVHTSDIPAMSGIGSSSSFTVGFLNALYSLQGKMVTKRELAYRAMYVEQNLIGENVGSQDQIAAAFGGLNKIEFGRSEKNFIVYPITLTNGKMDLIQDHLMLFFTGFSRNASDIAGEQIRMTPNKKKELQVMMKLVDEAINVLNRDSDNIDEFGKLLHETWSIKKKLTTLITTSKIDEIYEAALKAGASGGKVIGAGGGGFILFFVKPERQPEVKEKLKKLLHVPFRFQNLGSQIVYYAPDMDF